MLWELVFMLVVLKIPVVYLCVVVWWAIKAEPQQFEEVGTVASLEPGPDCDWRTRRGPRFRRGPVPQSGGRVGRRGRQARTKATA